VRVIAAGAAEAGVPHSARANAAEAALIAIFMPPLPMSAVTLDQGRREVKGPRP
jgi:quercetin dioxygenase-like cupin family protein